jgi:hypothetical protein
MSFDVNDLVGDFILGMASARPAHVAMRLGIGGGKASRVGGGLC